jgi:hypothetical protein
MSGQPTRHAEDMKPLRRGITWTAPPPVGGGACPPPPPGPTPLPDSSAISMQRVKGKREKGYGVLASRNPMKLTRLPGGLTYR